MSTAEGGGNIVTDGLVLYLDAANSRSIVSGSTTWTDLSRSQNNGILTNGPAFNSGNGGSIVFDGVNNYVDLGNPTSLDITQFITHSIWINPTSNYAGGYNGILTKANSGSVAGSLSNTLLYIAPVNNYTVQYGKSDGTAGVAVTDTLPSYNQWICYTSTYDGINVILYRNGIEVSRGSQTGSIYNTNQNTGVKLGRDGRYNLVSGRQYNGKITGLLIYNRALSSTEVLQNYNATKGRFGL